MIKRRVARGRPKSHEKGDAIRQAAVELFLSDGFARTSMDAVANRAGVSKQTVYARFKNKNELFVACVGSKLEEYELALASSPGDLSLRQGLKTIGDGYLRLLCDRSVIALWRLMIAEAPLHPEPARMLYESGPARACTSLADFLAMHARAGFLAIDDYTAAARAFFALVRAEYHTRLLLEVIDGIPEETRRAHVAEAVGQFLKLYKS